MSTEIKPTNMPVNIDNTRNVRSNASNEKSAIDSNNASQNTAADTANAVTHTDKVSMTDTVSRLQGIESMLADIPEVDNNLVSEISKALAEGNLNIDYEATAAKLIVIESGKN